MKRARRISGAIATFAMLGLATTVAVAWALAAWLPHRDLTNTLASESSWGDEPRLPGLGPNEYLFFEQFWRPGMSRRAWYVLNHAAMYLGSELSSDLSQGSDLAPDLVGFGHWATSWGRLPRVIRGDVPVEGGLEDARGWPAPALWCRYRFSGAGAPAAYTPVGGLAIPIGDPARPGQVRALPLLPVWAGLAIDTLVYGLLWASIVLGVTQVRRLIRRRRGRCTHCGYDLLGDFAAGCPECGWRRSQVELRA